MTNARLLQPKTLRGPGLKKLRAEVLRGLRATQKYLPCKYFYDDHGSALFEQITELPEYYLTRTELAIMKEHAAAMAELLGSRCLLLEYGSGSSAKTRLLLDQMHEPVGYVPVDVSGELLQQTARDIAKSYPALEVIPVNGDFTRRFHVPATRVAPARRVVYFPGSTIGNFTPGQSVALFRRTVQLCGEGGVLLLGADLRKDSRVIEAAYNDSQGVTAEFNRNLLVRINRDLGADFDPQQFDHRAFYSAGHGRIEMHLISRRLQHVRIGNVSIRFAAGESIHTENSYKYSLPGLRKLAQAGGFDTGAVWVDEQQLFSVHYLVARAAGQAHQPEA